MDACTIIAKNYVPFARVLAKTFRAQHPDARFFVLVIDDPRDYIDPAEEPFELVTIDMLDIEHFGRMAALYDVLELSTAVKPWLLRWLLGPAGCERIAYLDPDIQIFEPLEEIDRLLHEHRVVVTPHILEPMPRDGHRPSETDILIAGTFNLGFIGLSRGPDADALIDWWAERLERDCIVAPERGYFVDQRWIDFAPGLIESFHVLRNPGYNVAYWNVWGRDLAETPDGLTVNGESLRFFHFSGYDPRHPGRLSKHDSRISLVDQPVVRRLCDAYGAALMENGFERSIEWPYTYSELPVGIELDRPMRALYREAEASGDFDGDPFTQGGARRFVEWLNEPAETGGHAGVTRYLKALRDARPDLAGHFGDLSGPDASRFVEWARMFGRTEVPIPEMLLPPEPAAEGVAPNAQLPSSSFRTGVNVVGYFKAVLGVGEVARQVVSAIESQEFPLALVGLDAPFSEQSERFEHETRHGPIFPTNLICVNADSIQAFLEEMGPEFRKDRYSIGLWWWEVSKFPERWSHAFNYVDEVWACSRHITDALAAVSPVPVVHMPLPVAAPQVEPMSRADLGLPEGFLFLFTFDYHSVFQRKNPVALVAAFKQAFAPGDGAKLVVKSINHDVDPDNHAALVAAAAEHPDIVLVERYVSRAEKDAMLAAADCYASLHRSEGFGLGLAESMHLAKPVIATGYSGNLDFMTPHNSYLVDHEMVPIGAGAEPYPEDGEWAEPSVEHAAELMRHVFENRDEAADRGRRARADIARTHSPDAAGKAMIDRLLRVQLRPWASKRVKPADLPRTLNAEWLYRKVADGPPFEGAPSRVEPAKQLLRKAILRVLRPYSVHQQELDRELVMALDRLDFALHGMAQSIIARIDSQSEALARASERRQQEIREEIAEVAKLRPHVEESTRLWQSFGFRDGALTGPTADTTGYPEAPREPWTHEYVERHAQFVTASLDDTKLLSLFRRREPLPEGYGVGYDERVVEFPWVFTRDLRGRLLDAGSGLNHPHTLVRAQPRVDDITLVTLAPEPEAYTFMGVSYLYSDLRDLQLRNDSQDVVVCVSTLEHVGMDNSQYGSEAPRSADPDGEVACAVSELRRVLKPGGELFVTIPYGQPEDFGWVRAFDAAGVERIQEAFGAAAESIEVFRYDGGWRRSTLEEAAGARYRDHYTSDGPADDGAVAARAVACLSLRTP
jgi:glycosyltransferase involved in cell wall biosynthesis/SAM-dependent methyltransferase